MNEIIDRIVKSRGFENLEDPYAYKYALSSTPLKIDPFVMKALKQFSPAIYEDAKGFTKAPVPEEALEAILNYQVRDRKPVFTKREQVAFDLAVEKTRSVFMPSGQKLAMWFSTDVMFATANDSAAGFSFPGEKKEDVCDQACDIAQYMAHMIREGYNVYTPPCKLAMRGHLREEGEKKTRPVWVQPYEIIIMEGLFAVPFIKHLEMHVPQVHFGEQSMPRLADRLSAMDPYDAEITLDWSSFDASVPNYLTDIAFDLIWDSFRFDEKYSGGKFVHNSKRNARGLDKVFEYLRTYFKRTKLMLPNGEVVRKKHGIPSGSMFTQIVGSIVNYLVVTFLTLCEGMKISEMAVLGDDSSFKTSKYDLVTMHKDFMEPTRRRAFRLFGMVLKEKKIRVALEQHERGFLGYQFKAGTFIRESVTWFRTALHVENLVDTLEKSASRMLAFYILGGVADFDFSQFFRYYIGCYPRVKDRSIPLERGVGKMIKYVMRLPSYEWKPDKLSLLGSTMCLAYGTKPFV